MGSDRSFSSQFSHPNGVWGHVAGTLMAWTTGKRNVWTLSLLELQPDDHVLEVGFGPGVGILQASRIVQHGSITGIDPSQVMKKQAERRNRQAIREGKVRLITGNIEEWPGFDQPFSKIFSVNSAPFWNDQAHVFQKLSRWLRPGGKIATTYQPLGKEALDLETFAKQLTANLEQANLVPVIQETKVFKPSPAMCVVAQKPT